MGRVGYLRTYDFPDDNWAKTDRPADRAEVPAWLRAHIADPFLINRTPFVVGEGSRVCVIDGRQHRLEVLPVAFPHLRLIQIHFWVDEVRWAGQVKEGLLPHPIELADEHQDIPFEHHAAAVADQIYLEITGLRVDPVEPRRTDLAALVFDEDQATLPGFVTHVGTFEGCAIGAAGYDLRIHGPCAEDADTFGAVLAVAGVLGRARHQRKRLIEAVAALADDVQAHSFDPWAGVEQTAQLQAAYVTFRRELNGEGFLNRARTKRLLADLSPQLQVPQSHLDDLDAAMASLDALSHSLLGLAIESTQKRVGHYGLFFAGLSILFATFATVDLANSPMDARAWVLAAVALTLTMFLFVRWQVARSQPTSAIAAHRRRATR